MYVAPGTYRESFVFVTMTSPTVETKILGDPSATQFSDIAPGPVVFTCYLTNDTTAADTSEFIHLNNRDFLTFQDLVIVGGTGALQGACVRGASTTSTDIVLRRCALIYPGTSTTTPVITIAADIAARWTIDSCVLWGGGVGISITLTKPASADLDFAIVVKNCLVLTTTECIKITNTGANSFKPGGVKISGCTLLPGSSAGAVSVGVSTMSTSIPCTLANSCCMALGSGTLLIGGAAGQLVEDYNHLWAVTLRSNVTAGTHSQSVPTYAPMLDIGQSWLHGFLPRPFLSPMAGSPLLGFGDDGSFVAVDALNRPRPAGGNSTSKGVGYLERHDTAAKEVTTTDAGSVGLVLLGPSDQDIKIPVDAAATTITVKMRYDSTHAATNKPQAILLDNAAIGVSTQTVTMTAAVDTWETLTIGPFTPTAKGVVVVRLVSRSAAAGGKAFADTVAVS